MFSTPLYIITHLILTMALSWEVLLPFDWWGNEGTEDGKQFARVTKVAYSTARILIPFYFKAYTLNHYILVLINLYKCSGSLLLYSSPIIRTFQHLSLIIQVLHNLISNSLFPNSSHSAPKLILISPDEYNHLFNKFSLDICLYCPLYQGHKMNGLALSF